MSVKKITVKHATLKIQTGFLPYIGKYVPGTLSPTDLPKRVDVEDPDTKEIHECKLIEIVTFQNCIPTVLCLLAEGRYPEECTGELLKRTKSESINQLALYLYAKH